MIRLQTESKPPPQPFIGVVYRGLCLFRGGNPQNPTFAKEGIPPEFLSHYEPSLPFACLRQNDGLSDKF
jgi:hypothetical protein